MQNKVIFFDLFDTLVKVDRGYLEPYFDRETDRLGDNGTLKDAEQTIKRLASMHPDLLEKGSISKIARDYEKMMAKSLKNIDSDVLKMLKSLKDNGYRMCIISDAAYVDIAAWKQSPLSKYIDDTVFSCEVGLIKPDPQLFEYAQKKMGNPTVCIFSGDGGHDELIGAQSVGMKTIKAEWIKNRRDEDLYRSSDYRVQNTTKFLSVIENIKVNEEQELTKAKSGEDIDTFIDSFAGDETKTPTKENNIVL